MASTNGVLEQPAVPAVAAVPRPLAQRASYRSVDVDEYCVLRSTGKRNRTGSMIWDVCRERSPVNFHHMGVGEENDPWSNVICEVQTETPEGTLKDRLALLFRITPQQLDFLRRFDQRLVDQLTEKSVDVLQKATKRDIVENMYQSPINVKDGQDPAARMGLVVRGHAAFLTKVYFHRKLPEGGWATPAVLVGWEQLEPVLANHRWRDCQIRGSFRVGGLQVVGKNIYTRWEFSELHLRESSGGNAMLGGLSEEELRAMQDME